MATLAPQDHPAMKLSRTQIGTYRKKFRPERSMIQRSVRHRGVRNWILNVCVRHKSSAHRRKTRTLFTFKYTLHMYKTYEAYLLYRCTRLTNDVHCCSSISSFLLINKLYNIVSSQSRQSNVYSYFLAPSTIQARYIITQSRIVTSWTMLGVHCAGSIRTRLSHFIKLTVRLHTLLSVL